MDDNTSPPDASASNPLAVAAEPTTDRCVWPHETPALRWLRDDFVQRLLAQLPSMVRGQWHLRLAGTSLTSAAQFLATVEEKTSCSSLKMDDDRNGDSPHFQTAKTGTVPISSGWVEITPSIAFPILNCFLGGASDDRFIPQRPLTTIERRLLLRVVQAVLQGLLPAWPQQPAPALVPDGDTALPSTPPVGEARRVMTASFDFALDRQAGTLRLCLEGSCLPQLCSPISAVGQKESVLEISAALPEADLSPQELAALAPGDILMTNEPLDGEIVIRVAGIPKFIGRLGTCNGRRAVTIVRRIS